MLINPAYIHRHISEKNIDSIIRVPTQYDDDFNSLVLDSKWTVKESAGTVYLGTLIPSHIIIKCSAGTDRYKIEQAYTSTSAVSFTAKVLGPMHVNYSCAMIEVYDADYSDAMRIRLEYNGNVQLRLASKDSGTDSWSRQVVQLSGNTVHSTFFIHLQKDSSHNWFAAASLDGLSFVRTATYNKSFTPGFVQVTVRQDNSTYGCLRGIDWFRKDWLTL